MECFRSLGLCYGVYLVAKSYHLQVIADFQLVLLQFDITHYIIQFPVFLMQIRRPALNPWSRNIMQVHVSLNCQGGHLVKDMDTGPSTVPNTYAS
jgi:hypothetical protein